MQEYTTRTFELGIYEQLIRTSLEDILLILAISVGDLLFREEISEHSLDTKTISFYRTCRYGNVNSSSSVTRNTVYICRGVFFNRVQNNLSFSVPNQMCMARALQSQNYTFLATLPSCPPSNNRKNKQIKFSIDLADY